MNAERTASANAPAVRGPARETGIPFDTARLDEILDNAGIDALVVSSKHNVQYLLGGYRFFFFEHFDAIGVSRYLPLFLYFKGQPERSIYIGNSMESWEQELGKFWVPQVETRTWGTTDAMRRAVDHLRSLGPKPFRIGIERAFLPADAEECLREALPEAEIADAIIPLERLRARKSAGELELLREASVRVVDSMLAVIGSHGPGVTKNQLTEALRREEVARGLTFEYCLITAGASLNRAPSDQPWREGDILSLDSGGSYRGYIGDLCRMAILGEPDAELQDLLSEVDEIQQAARQPIRPGRLGGEIFESAERALDKSKNRTCIHFVAHGMGLISHEAPRLSGRTRQGYAGEDADRPLQSGMVISIETTMAHPRRGFIKLEDTVAVAETGYEAFGDHGRGWNRGNLGTRGA